MGKSAKKKSAPKQTATPHAPAGPVPAPAPPPAPAARAPQRSFEECLRSAQGGTMTAVELMTLAQQLCEANCHSAAVQLQFAWLQRAADPAAFAVHFNMGVNLAHLQMHAQAAECYRNAIKLNPECLEAHLNLGTTMERLGAPQEAVDAWKGALARAREELPAHRPLRIHAYNNLGRLLEIHKRHQEAERHLAASLELDPTQHDVLTHWVHLRQKQCEWPVFRPFPGITERAMRNAASALAMLSLSDDPEEQLATARRFVAEKVKLDVPRLAPPDGYAHPRIRIGYLSSDFCWHAVTILTAELYELHDRRRFEVFAFSWSREDGTPMRARVVQAMDHYVKIDAMSDEEAARCIRDHEIDLLVDLQGLTSGARPGILAFKPAPVQLTYLGLLCTTGLPAVDYVIADRYVLPEAMAAHYTERPLYLPETYQVNDRKRAIGPTPTRESCGLPGEAFVFCAFNNSFKITAELFAVWMRILRDVPDGVLWLIGDDPEVRGNLRAAARGHGVDPGRLVFAERAAPPDYLARFRIADLFLDTFPFNGGATASDALWAGLPIVTCSGKTFISRMAGSLLRAVGLPQLITGSFEAYAELAVALARAPQTVADCKAHLRDGRDAFPLFDTPRFVRDLEAELEKIVRRPTGAPPRSTDPVAPPGSLLESTQHAFGQAGRGALSITDLVNAAQALILAGHPDIAADLYRLWLAQTPSPIAYAARFNLAVLLENTADEAGAEAAYRAALAQKPGFIEALVNLCALLERTRRTDQALDLWRAALGSMLLDASADPAGRALALDRLGRLLEGGGGPPDPETRLLGNLKAEPGQLDAIARWIRLRHKPGE